MLFDDFVDGFGDLVALSVVAAILESALGERGRDQGGITGRICASCLMGAKKFPREG